jgi:hypothetical protein
MSPDEIFSKTTSTHQELLKLMPWGCPGYALMPTLQDGKKLPKWKPQSRRCQNMGWSPMHASSVGLVRNLCTGRLSPQFHVVYDPWFETVAENSEKPPEAWDVMMANHRHDVSYEDEEEADKQHQLSDDWLSKEELLDRRAAENKKREVLDFDRPKTTRRNANSTNLQASTPTESTTESAIESVEDPPSLKDADSDSDSDSSSSEAPISSLRLSTRKRVQRKVMNIGHTNVRSYFASMDRTRELQLEHKWTQRYALASWLTSTIDPEEGYIDISIPDISLRAYKASKKGKNPDLPNYREAMEGEHTDEFKEAMKKEITALKKHGTWTGVLKNTIPPDGEIIPLTWAFRIKRKPNGEFDKFKARLVVRGDLQDDERETYAPVVKWSTIRTVLAFALQMKLKTRQIDFDNAFVQIELNDKERIYVTLLVGVHHSIH